MPTEDDGIVRSSQPQGALAVIGMQHSKGPINSEDCRNAGEDVNGQRKGSVFPSSYAPVAVGCARREAKDQSALLIGEAPEIRDVQECPQSRTAQASAIWWPEPSRCPRLGKCANLIF